MSFSLWPSAFVDNVSTIPASFLNDYVRVPISRALDGVGGGTYTLTSNIVFNGGNGIAIEFLRLSGTNKLQYQSRSLVRVCDVGMPFLEDASQWNQMGAGWVQSSALAAALTMPIHAPHNATITLVEVLVDNPAHGGSWPPNTATRLQIWKTDITGTNQVGSTYNDDTSVQATYEAIHWLPSSAVSLAPNRTGERYFARIVGESGANALTGVEVHPAIRVTYTITEQDED